MSPRKMALAGIAMLVVWCVAMVVGSATAFVFGRWCARLLGWE